MSGELGVGWLRRAEEAQGGLCGEWEMELTGRVPRVGGLPTKPKSETTVSTRWSGSSGKRWMLLPVRLEGLK